MDDDREPLVIPRVDMDDVEQEAELLKLEGKNPRKSIIYKRMSRNSGMLFSTWLPADAQPMEWAAPVVPDPETIQAIVDWALAQTAEIQEQVFGFLDNPDETGLQELLEVLREHDILGEEVTHSRREKRSLADLIRRTLRKGPRTKQELYQMARREHVSKRPEAAVRQILRRLEQQGEVYERPRTGKWFIKI